MTTSESLISLATNTAAVLIALSPGILYVQKQMSSQFRQCEDDRAKLSGRIGALEAVQVGDFPRWVRNLDGVFQTVSPEFVRVFGAPYGLHMVDFIGKRFQDLPFSNDLIQRLKSIDERALRETYAYGHGVEISEGVKVTIIKTVRMSASGDVIYVGCAVPER